MPAALLRYPLRTDLVLPRIEGPVLLLHGARDTLIPPQHVQKLLALSPRAELVLLPEAAHNDLQDLAAFKLRLGEALRRTAPDQIKAATPGSRP